MLLEQFGQSSAQGGMVIFVASRHEAESGVRQATSFNGFGLGLQAVDESLPFSLSAETQAAANAVDERDWARRVRHLMVWPFEDPH